VGGQRLSRVRSGLDNSGGLSHAALLAELGEVFTPAGHPHIAGIQVDQRPGLRSDPKHYSPLLGLRDLNQAVDAADGILRGPHLHRC